MYMERNEAPALPSERDQRTDADERTRREIGSRAIADMCPSCERESNLSLTGVSEVMASTRARAKQVRENATKRKINAMRGALKTNTAGRKSSGAKPPRTGG